MDSIDKELDVIFKRYDDHFKAGEFEAVDRALNDLVFTHMDDALLIGHLSAAYPGRDKLRGFRFFKQRVQAMLRERHGDTEEVKAMLKGFDT